MALFTFGKLHLHLITSKFLFFVNLIEEYYIILRRQGIKESPSPKRMGFVSTHPY